MILPPIVFSQIPQVMVKIVSLITPALKILEKKLPLLVDKIKPIADVIWKCCQVTEGFKGNDTAEAFGDKSIQAEKEGITLASCEGDFEAYQNEIDNFKLDPKKSEEISREEKLAASLVLMTFELEKKYGSDIVGLYGLIHRNGDFFTVERISSYLNACKEGYLTIGNIFDYFSSNLNRRDSIMVENKLIGIEKNIHSIDSESDPISKIRDVRE